MIPKIIHYCWFGGAPLPKDVKMCIDSWKKMCPDYKIIEWNEANYDVNKHPFIKKAYEEKCWAFVSDYARLDVIYSNGGIYLDTDVELLKNIDFLLEKECFVALDQAGRIATGLGFGACKGHKGIEVMLNQYATLTFDKENKKELSCPPLNTKPFIERGYVANDTYQVIYDTHIFPAKYFDPIGPLNTTNLLCKDTISIHHYSASWTSLSQRIKRKIVRLIGFDTITKFKKFIKRK